MFNEWISINLEENYFNGLKSSNLKNNVDPNLNPHSMSLTYHENEEFSSQKSANGYNNSILKCYQCKLN